ARPAVLPEDVIGFASRLALAVGAEGLRADLVLCRAAAALAGWEGRAVATVADVERVAPLALAHRRRRRPFDPPTLSPDELRAALAAAHAVASSPGAGPASEASDHADPSADSPQRPGRSDTEGQPGRSGEHSPQSVAGDGGAPSTAPLPGAPGASQGQPGGSTGSGGEADHDTQSWPGNGRPGNGRSLAAGLAGNEQARSAAPAGPARRSADDGAETWSDLAGGALGAAAEPVVVPVAGPRPAAPVTGPGVTGPVVGARVPGPGGPSSVAVMASVRAKVARGGTGGGLEPGDLREPVRRRAATRTVVLAVDTSGSMGSARRVEAAAGAVLGLLADAYRSRHRVALVAFGGRGAEVVLRPTASVEVARARLADMATGGPTPLAEGIDAALETALRAAEAGDNPTIVLLTDGRATAGPGAFDRALVAASAVAAAGMGALVLDAEDGPAPLGLAPRVAAALGGPCVALSEVSALAVEGAVRAALGVGGRP
ncbi:MAG: VWA domain-containing protein, partial [Actinomycetota bacterium]